MSKKQKKYICKFGKTTQFSNSISPKSNLDCSCGFSYTINVHYCVITDLLIVYTTKYTLLKMLFMKLDFLVMMRPSSWLYACTRIPSMHPQWNFLIVCIHDKLYLRLLLDYFLKDKPHWLRSWPMVYGSVCCEPVLLINCSLVILFMLPQV